MIITEDEAKTKWCPMARVELDTSPHFGGGNRWPGGGDAKCLASGCMMWCGVTGMPTVVGYCGLAGKPWK